MKFLAPIFLFIALFFLFALSTSKQKKKSGPVTAYTLVDSPQKATIRVKEQDKFLQLFLEKEKSREAWGLFSYGGYSDAGQFQIFSLEGGVEILYSDPKFMDGKEGSKDGTLAYEKFTLDKKSTAWKGFHQTLMELENPLKGFQITHFDAFQFDFLHITKSKNKVQVERVYFDDPYLRKKQTQKLQELLKAFEDLIDQVKK